MFDLLIETSWEVCNKIGGIYAVLSTKARTLHDQHGDKVIFIGPDVWTDENESPVFQEDPSLLSEWKSQAFLPHDVAVRIGRWAIPGNPIAILVDFKGVYAHKNDLYGKMWTHYSVDSLHGYGDYDEACTFAVAAAFVIEDIARFMGHDKKIIAHFDEWTTGMGLLHVKKFAPQVATIFTTHATSIGRSICGNGKPLYDYLKGYNGNQMARELNMESKHSLEKAAAHHADAFTTVSEVTQTECTQLLERTPLVTPNAFEQGFVPQGEDLVKVRKQAREKLIEVASALLGKSFRDDVMLVATSGRCEFRNKGIDMFLDAMGILCGRANALPSKQNRRQVVAFVLVPAWTREPRQDLIQALDERLGNRLNDPYFTHAVHNPNEDVIMDKMRHTGLTNQVSDDLVNVIDVPCYLNGDDGIFNMKYYDLLPGFDLTVFPSYYEPWGYTPLESIAFGVPTITTDLAGFGRWVNDQSEGKQVECGVNVIHRSDSNYSQALAEMVESIVRFLYMTPEQVAMLREAAQRTAHEAVWKNFIKHYDDAYVVALENCARRKNDATT